MPDEEKTEKATPKRKAEAREKGQVARSQDFSMAVLMMATAALLTIQGPRVAALLLSNMREFLGGLPARNFGIPEAVGLLKKSAVLVGLVVGPLAAGVMITALLAGVVQVGFKFTPKALEFNPDKFNPVSGMKRIFNVRGIMRMLFSAAKLAVMALVLWLTLRGKFGVLLNLSRVDIPVAAAVMLDSVLRLLWVVASVLMVLGIGDLVYQKWQHARDLRMTKQEVKDEQKNAEGDPLIKGRIRQAQKRMARMRMMQEVPKADVVITNPTHAAVALRYDQEVMAAPRVVAKGWNETALRIREIAGENGVPIYEDPPLARGLCRAVDVGDEVPVKFYQAVAAVLSHVYRMTGKFPAGAGGGRGR